MAEHGKLTADIPAFDYPASAKKTVNMARDVTAADFAIAAPKGANEVTPGSSASSRTRRPPVRWKSG